MHKHRNQDAAESEQWDRDWWEAAQGRTGFGQNGLYGSNLQGCPSSWYG
jgi:hypothetical protein